MADITAYQVSLVVMKIRIRQWLLLLELHAGLAASAQESSNGKGLCGFRQIFRFLICQQFESERSFTSYDNSY